jgi:hypothetical protein
MATPVLVRCSLCTRPNPAGLIVSTAERSWADAIDHALDMHRAELLADPELTQDAFTITTGDPSRPTPLRRTCIRAARRNPS